MFTCVLVQLLFKETAQAKRHALPQLRHNVTILQLRQEIWRLWAPGWVTQMRALSVSSLETGGNRRAGMRP